MTYKTIIVDDEPNSSTALSTLLEMYCPELEIVSVFNDSRQALDYLLNNSPDLVFLDIQMPYLTGIDLLKKFNNPTFHVIFITAYDQFAIDAIKLAALDYLLKPVDPEKLKDSINRFIEKKIQGSPSDSSQENLTKKSGNGKLVIQLQNKTLFISPKDILYLEADSNYTKFHMVSEKSFLTSKTIKFFENEISDSNFFRPHQSYLVNTTHIEAYSKVDNALVLTNEKLIPVSKNKKDQLMKILLSI